ncbi:MAG: branched-chain amino acid ABC transporter permease [Chelatococcus sp.]|uniref:branched-chain amino acid ABC transporter permease n=1 Tax=Chelatococcus sp. TaxID=1953771 RepID=UPI0025BF6646|nr:branched-chain amino acid ABC transporter permease [Chelatococcus sp.]MBX3539405.1 branched-chain amino acid ABC transporter permease [Chelatococcus sp.]
MTEFLHQLVAGIATGGIYASLALALVMIYQTTHHVNFAQGEMATASTFGAWYLLSTGLSYWLVFALVLGASFIVGALVERVVMKRVSGRSDFAFVAVSVGLLIVFNSASSWIGGTEIRQFPSPFPSFLGGRLVSAHEVGSFLVTLIVLCALLGFLRFTPFGLAMRAAAQNPLSSRFVGIRVDWVLTIGWGLAAAIGAVAGMMIAPVVFLEPNMMGGVLLYAFAGALLGGIDNPWGAVVGGFVVGMFENIIGVYIAGPELKLTVALALIVAVVMVRPAGLFGRTLTARV